MGLVAMRKMVVIQRIAQLEPREERERAERLYWILDRIEFHTIIPLFMGFLAVPVGVLLALIFIIKSGMTLPQDETLLLLCAFVCAALSYILGVFFLKVLFCNRRRELKIRELEDALALDATLYRTLEILKQLDPAMARNIRRHLPQPP